MQVSFKAVIFLDSHDTEQKNYVPFQSSSSTMQMILFFYHVQPIKMVAVDSMRHRILCCLETSRPEASPVHATSVPTSESGTTESEGD